MLHMALLVELMVLHHIVCPSVRDGDSSGVSDSIL